MSRELTRMRAAAAAVARLREWTSSINASDEETAAEDIATAYLAELRLVDAPPLPEIRTEDVEYIAGCLQTAKSFSGPAIVEQYSRILAAVEYCAAQNRRPDA